MTVDAATLADLEVVSSRAPGGLTLLALLDRTWTRVGRDRLRRMLISPLSDADAICARQDALRALAGDADTYYGIVGRVDLDSIENYFSSRWQRPSARSGLARFARYLRPAWYRQYALDVRAAHTHVMALLTAAAQLRDRLSESAAGPLQDVARALTTSLDTPEARQLRALATVNRAAGFEAFDEVVRSTARGVLAALLDGVATIEAMWSAAVAAADRGWCYPRPAAGFLVRRLFHPFLGEAAIGNDLDLHEVGVCFVTGPNMAGKSTFLKAVAAATVLAHCGCAVPADAMEFPVVGTVFSSMQVADDLGAAESFYLAEVRRIRALALALNARGSILAIVDEPFRGTNVHDAAEATLAVITRLAAHPGALVFLASHLAEIVPAFRGDPRIRQVHFAADVSGEEPRFDYRIRPGTSDQRLGMSLLRQEGVLDLLERVPDVIGSRGVGSR